MQHIRDDCADLETLSDRLRRAAVVARADDVFG
jgi:hypothetical protein